jgi:hypothetical protein
MLPIASGRLRQSSQPYDDGLEGLAFAEPFLLFGSSFAACGFGGVFSIRFRTSSRLGAPFMGKTPYIYRRLSAKDREILSQYTHLAGLTVWASNALHAKFLLIFEDLLKDVTTSRAFSQKTARAMWHSLRSDDIQRAVLKALASEVMEQSHPITKSLMWALKSAGKLAEFRNDAVHTAFHFDDSTGQWRMAPNQVAGAPHRVEKLNRVGYAKLFRLLLGDLIQLRVYTEHLWAKISGDGNFRMPRRPLLQSHRLVQQTPPTSRTRQRHAKESLKPEKLPLPTMQELSELLSAAEYKRLKDAMK